MYCAAQYTLAGQTVLPTWLVLTYLLHCFAELCLSPVGLSYFSKLAPPRFVGQVMGMWFLFHGARQQSRRPALRPVATRVILESLRPCS